MVAPIIAGGVVLAFITWGEGVFGKSTFNKITKAAIGLGILGIVYIVYKSYKAWMNAKEAVQSTYQDISEKAQEGWEWVLEGSETGKEKAVDGYNWIMNEAEEDIKGEIILGVKKGIVSAPESGVRSIYGQVGVDYLKWSAETGKDIGLKTGTSIRKVYDKYRWW